MWVTVPIVQSCMGWLGTYVSVDTSHTSLCRASRWEPEPEERLSTLQSAPIVRQVEPCLNLATRYIGPTKNSSYLDPLFRTVNVIMPSTRQAYEGWNHTIPIPIPPVRANTFARTGNLTYSKKAIVEHWGLKLDWTTSLCTNVSHYHQCNIGKSWLPARSLC